MRYLKWVNNMLDTVEQKGEAKKSRQGREVAWFRLNEGVLEIAHYRTPILKLDIIQGKVLDFGGWSDTDRNIINNVLNRYGFKSRAFIKDEEMKMAVDVGERPAIFNWDYIMKELEKVEMSKIDEGYVKEIFVGTVFNLLPSGKYYTPWACSNVTEEEAEEDEIWWEQAYAECAEHGCCIISGEGDPCDLFISVVIDDEFTDLIDNVIGVIHEIDSRLQRIDYFEDKEGSSPYTVGQRDAYLDSKRMIESILKELNLNLNGLI